MSKTCIDSIDKYSARDRDRLTKALMRECPRGLMPRDAERIASFMVHVQSGEIDIEQGHLAWSAQHMDEYTVCIWFHW